MSAAANSIPYFKRAWQVLVHTSDGGDFIVSNKEAEGLRVTFAVDTYVLLAYWTASVSVFNLKTATAQKVKGAGSLNDFWKFNQPLVSGDSVSLSAGYQVGGSGEFDPSASVIYTGRVLQPVWTRENVVDYRLTLRCVTGLADDSLNLVSFAMAGGATAYDVVGQICDQGGIPLDNVDERSKTLLSQGKMARGQAIHGRPYDLIRQIAKQNKLLSWVGPNGLNVRSFDPQNPPAAPDFSYGPSAAYASSSPTTVGSSAGKSKIKPTLIGTPQQTQDGITFRILLDSSVKIGDVVQISQEVLINLYPIQIGKLPPVPSRNGLYVVAGVRHCGDTRGQGDDWYTEITGLTMDFFANFLAATNPN
jgi:hypothetical protein